MKDGKLHHRATLCCWCVGTCSVLCADICCVSGAHQHVRELPGTNLPGGVQQAAQRGAATPCTSSSSTRQPAASSRWRGTSGSNSSSRCGTVAVQYAFLQLAPLCVICCCTLMRGYTRYPSIVPTPCGWWLTTAHAAVAAVHFLSRVFLSSHHRLTRSYVQLQRHHVSTTSICQIRHQLFLDLSNGACTRAQVQMCIAVAA